MHYKHIKGAVQLIQPITLQESHWPVVELRKYPAILSHTEHTVKFKQFMQLIIGQVVHRSWAGSKNERLGHVHVFI